MRIRGLVATLAGTAALVGLAAAPLPLPEHLANQVTFDSVIDLTGWQFDSDLSPAFRARWGLPEHDPSDEHLCTGRAPLGWFSLR